MVALRKKAPDCTGGPVGEEEGDEEEGVGGEESFSMHIAQCTGASMAIAQMVGEVFQWWSCVGESKVMQIAAADEEGTPALTSSGQCIKLKFL